jgi:pyruvate ferredoxin oxidoreductase alpha subunit
MRKALEVSLAISEAVKLARCEVIAAYPITPQTHIVESLAEMVADGELDAEYINVESEHSAMSACVGASLAGARTFTATSAQGLALMHEILFIASYLRLPIVMAVANRALSAPLNIWGDQSDIMAERDCGWIQLFGENGQELFDLTLCAFKIAEKALLPVVVNLDGFTASHVVEPVEILSQEEVDKFLPPYNPKFVLDPKNPKTFGAYALPDFYTEAKKQQDEILRNSYSIILELFEEFNNMFGRKYEPIERYKTEDAEILILCAGGISGTARVAIDKMREEGKKVGLLKLNLWRPFPYSDLISAIKNCKTLSVVDRAISFGGAGGPIATEIKSYLYKKSDINILSFIAGLGGRDVKIEDFEKIFEKSEELEKIKQFEIIGVRE